ncbi:MAG: MFS transporter [bacterium]
MKGFGPETWSWMSYDFANSAFATSITAVIFNQYYAGVIAGGAQGTDFSLLGYNFNLPGATMFQMSVLLGTTLTVILSPLIGVFADLKGNKKKLLIVMVIIGSLCTAALAFLKPGDVLQGWFIYGVALCMFLLALNLYNAFLPQIASPKNIGLISGFSWAIGYLGGGGCLLLNLIMLQNPQALGFEEGELGISHVILTVAAWWLLFSLPTFWGVRERPARKEVLGQPVKFGQILKNLRKTFQETRKYKQLWVFLIAYFFFTNGIETTISSASIFGAEELHMDTSSLIMLFLVVQFTAFPGAILFGILVDKLGNKKALSIALFFWIVALAFVYQLGIFWDPVTEFYMAAVLVGLVMGGKPGCSQVAFCLVHAALSQRRILQFLRRRRTIGVNVRAAVVRRRQHHYQESATFGCGYGHIFHHRTADSVARR